MKELPFQRQGRLPLTLNVRILKLWNSTVCSARSCLPSYYDTLSQGRGGYHFRLFPISGEIPFKALSDLNSFPN